MQDEFSEQVEKVLDILWQRDDELSSPPVGEATVTEAWFPIHQDLASAFTVGALSLN